MILPRRSLALALALAALDLSSVAQPAAAYPTAVWNVPTGKVTAGGNVHLGSYTYSAFAGVPTEDVCGMFGVFPGFDLGGMTGVGGIEAGFDGWALSPTGPFATFHGKLQLVGEGDMNPAIAVGGLGLGNTQDLSKSDNLLYLSVTKELGVGGMSLGSFTVGGFTSNDQVTPTGNAGFMAGWSRELMPSLAAGVDFMSGLTGYSGTNLYLGYGILSNLYLGVGYYFSLVDSGSNAAFLALDWDLPTGLYGGGKDE